MKYISDLIRKEQVEFICLQETKCEQLSKERCYQIWGSNGIDWIEIGAVNNGGRIVTMWKKNCFELKRYRNGNNFSIIEGVWKIGTPIEIMIVNIYCGGTLRENKIIWDELSEIRKSHLIKLWCVAGDFNSIRCVGERRGQSFNVNIRKGYQVHGCERIKAIYYFKRRSISSFVNYSIVSKLNMGKVLIPRFVAALHDSPKHSSKRSIDYFGLSICLRVTRS